MNETIKQFTPGSLERDRDVIERSYPFPIAHACYKSREIVCDSTDYDGRATAIVRLFGSTVKFLAALALAEYAASPSFNADLNDDILSSSGSLSDGDWANFLHRVLTYTRKNKQPIYLPELHERYFKHGDSDRPLYKVLEQCVELRNKFAHRELMYQDFIELEVYVHHLLARLDFLQHYLLVSQDQARTVRNSKIHRCRSHMSYDDRRRVIEIGCKEDLEHKHLLLIVPSDSNARQGIILDLYPFYTLQDDYQLRLSFIDRVDDDTLEVSDGIEKLRLPGIASDLRAVLERQGASPLVEPMDLVYTRQSVTSLEPVLKKVESQTKSSNKSKPAPPRAEAAPPDRPATLPLAAEELNTTSDRFIATFDAFVESIANDQPAQQLLGTELLQWLHDRRQQLHDRFTTDFTLVVVGQFNRGKSTLINALLGAQVAPTDVTYETITINEIAYGPTPQVTLFLYDGRCVSLSLEDIKVERLTEVLNSLDEPRESEVTSLRRMGARGLSQWLIDRCDDQKLRAICAGLGVDYDALPGSTPRERAPELVLSMRQTGRGNELADVAARIVPVSPAVQQSRVSVVDPTMGRSRRYVQRVEIQMPIPWLRGIRLVDTPGTGLSSEHDAMVQAYLPRADVVLYVTSASASLSQTERAFLQNAIHAYDFAKVFFVVNRLDTIRTAADAARVLDRVRGITRSLFADAPVFGLSALTEFCRQSGDEPPPTTLQPALDQAFSDFRARLHESILLNRDMIRLDRAVAGVEQVLVEFQAKVDYLRKMLDTNHTERATLIEQEHHDASNIYQRVETHRTRIASEIERLSQQTVTWIDELLNRVASEALPAISTYQADDLQQHYQFFLNDLLRDAVNTCIDVHRPMIARMVADAYEALGLSTQEAAMFEANQPDDARRVVGEAVCGDRAWTNLDMLSFVVDQGLRRMFGITNEVVVGFLTLDAAQRQLKAAPRAAALQKRLQNALPELRTALHVELREFYHDVAQEIDRQLSDLSARETDSALATIRQAQTLVRQSHEDRATVLEQFQHVLFTIEGVREELGTLRLQPQ